MYMMEQDIKKAKTPLQLTETIMDCMKLRNCQYIPDDASNYLKQMTTSKIYFDEGKSIIIGMMYMSHTN
jgi:hypothetical protein